MYPYHNDIVIVSDKLARLIGIGDDGDDYYYICQEMYPQTKPSWCTYVGWCESLKGKIDPKHYECIDGCFEMNGAKKQKNFMLNVIDQLVNKTGNG